MFDESKLLGLNQADRDRIKQIGYSAWWIETCKAQEERLKVKSARNRNL